MKKYLLFLAIFLLAMPNLNAQKKGQFTEYMNAGGKNREVRCQVPSNYSSSKQYILIIGMHPNQTPPESMIQMLGGIADDLDAILLCPDHQGDDNGPEIAQVLYDWAHDNYNIDPAKRIMTGYSAGGFKTGDWGLYNTEKLSGIITIGAAPSPNIVSQVANKIKRFPVGVICGSSDQNKSYCEQFISAYEQYGGPVNYVSVPGQGHYGDYYWGSAAFVEDWMECYDFIVNAEFKPGDVVLSSPTMGQEFEAPQDKITLEWQEAMDAEQYEIAISLNGDIVENKLTDNTTYEFKNPVVGERYYWKVRAANNVGEGAWSSEWYFTVTLPAPEEEAALAEPQNEAQDVELEATLKWAPIPNAETYHIQVFEDPMGPPQIDEEIDASGDGQQSFTLEELEQGIDYSWKIRGENSGGEGPWSELWQFTTLIYTPETAPALLDPDEDELDVDIDIRLRWQSVEHAQYYHLQIWAEGSEEMFLEVDDIEPQATHILYDITGLEYITKYFWRVRATNRGEIGPWSDEKSFTTYDPSSVTEFSRNMKVEFLLNESCNSAVITTKEVPTSELNMNIIDIIGNNVATLPITPNTSQTVDLSHLAPGCYIVSISGTDCYYMMKMMK